MTTSKEPFPSRLTAIDDLTRSDHYHLDAEDECYFLGEYTSRKGYSFSETNSVVSNFKKSPDRKGRPEWRYKGNAIGQVASAFTESINHKWLKVATLVPIPPSRMKSDPLYDDRMLQMLRAIAPSNVLDIREIVSQLENRSPAHEASDGDRPKPDTLIQNYTIEECNCTPTPKVIGIFDDLLVTGASFKAMQCVLRQRFPKAKICGFFIARRVPDSDFDALFSEISL